MTLFEIIEIQLKQVAADGLYNGKRWHSCYDPCTCPIDALFSNCGYWPQFYKCQVAWLDKNGQLRPEKR